MSESPDVAEFEAARNAAMSEDGGEEYVEAGHEGADTGEEAVHEEERPKDWAKIAQDKDAALAAERVRRKNEARARRELEERLAKLEQQGAGKQSDPFEDLVSRLRDDDEDPIGDITGLKQVVRQFIADQKAERERAQTQTQTARQFEAFKITFEESEQDFASDHPDYYDAAKHYREERQAELEALGFSGPQLQAALAQDLIGVVRTAMDSGRDPAETVYNLAKRRGFASGVKQAEDKLQKLAASTAASARPTGRPAGSGNLTPGSVAGLKGAAFDAAFAKLREEQRRAK